MGGIFLHLAVFFLFRIDFEQPLEVAQQTPRLSYPGAISAENSAFMDPLILLLSDQRTALPTGVRDFREISISREISPHPPSLLLGERTQWPDWVPNSGDSINPGTWILGRTVNPLRNYARDASVGPPLRDRDLTIRIENFSDGSIRSIQLPIPEDLAASFAAANAPNPPVFLLDRSDPFSSPPPVSVSSSGDVSFDRILGSALAKGWIDSEIDNDYYRLTLFLPPPRRE